MLKFKYLHDHQTLSLFKQVMARQELYFVGAMGLFHFVLLMMLLQGLVREGYAAALDTDDYSTVFIIFLAFTFIVWQLRKSAKAVGILLYLAFLPRDTKHNEQIDGVSKGDVEVTLSHDSVEWGFANARDKIHLAAFFRSSRAKSFLLLKNSLNLTHFIQLDDTKNWLRAFRKNRKTAAKAGWALPDQNDDMNHYDLPAHVFLAVQARGAAVPVVAGSLLAVVIAVILWAFCSIMFATSVFDAEPFSIQQAGFLLLVITAGICTMKTLPILRGAWIRHRRRLTIIGPEDIGVTHGATAYSMSEKGIDVFRAFYQQHLNWNAVESVDVWDGWIGLRAGDQTLAIIPDTDNARNFISQSGLQSPPGPWVANKQLQTWVRPS